MRKTALRTGASFEQRYTKQLPFAIQRSGSRCGICQGVAIFVSVSHLLIKLSYPVPDDNGSTTGAEALLEFSMIVGNAPVEFELVRRSLPEVALSIGICRPPPDAFPLLHEASSSSIRIYADLPAACLYDVADRGGDLSAITTCCSSVSDSTSYRLSSFAAYGEGN